MASVLDRFRNLITKNAQQTAAEYNKAIYQFLGESIVWNPENDDTYIQRWISQKRNHLFDCKHYHKRCNNNSISECMKR
jgi:hypothetical protein